MYGFLNVAPLRHDFDDVDNDAEEFDRRIGAPGLHRVGSRVRAAERETVLPPGPFGRSKGSSFWRDAPNPYDGGVV